MTSTLNAYQHALVNLAYDYTDDRTWEYIEDAASIPTPDTFAQAGRQVDVPGSMGDGIRFQEFYAADEDLPLFRELVRLIEAGDEPDMPIILYHTAAKNVRSQATSN